ncbi:hypothetical protein ABB29_00215 [Pseudoxanthomonas dokdonensis]|uniref:Protein tonB n=2 Tax=Pseudoxanthomonas dokdonensis TaxID=344882 RepID=A0A0R0CPY3_9GAMM|nr:hypothetical protein ABB29_00215 [Pseudoxanthomonas dokdonensis]
MNVMIKAWTGLLLMMWVLCGSADASAAGKSDLIKQIEASILLTGTIDVDLLGEVKSYHLNSLDKVPQSVQGFLDKSIRAWKFDVTALPNAIVGPNTVLRNQMSLRVVAKADDKNNYEVRIAGASFPPVLEEKEDIRADGKLKPPVYPGQMAMAGARATTYLLLKIGKDGQVQDVIAEQVNLRALANSEKQMQQWRELFARNAIAAARKWRFLMPADMDDSEMDYRVARVPIEFAMWGDDEDADGWVSYVPGPRAENPWPEQHRHEGFSPDALASNGIYMQDQGGLRLLSELQPGDQ